MAGRNPQARLCEHRDTIGLWKSRQVIADDRFLIAEEILRRPPGVSVRDQKISNQEFFTSHA
jgi:hypothetical protein